MCMELMELMELMGGPIDSMQHKFHRRAEGGGGRKGCGVVLTTAPEVLALQQHSMLSIKEGVQQVLPCLNLEGATIYGPAIFPFCSPPSQ